MGSAPVATRRGSALCGAPHLRLGDVGEGRGCAFGHDDDRAAREPRQPRRQRTSEREAEPSPSPPITIIRASSLAEIAWSAWAGGSAAALGRTTSSRSPRRSASSRAKWAATVDSFEPSTPAMIVARPSGASPLVCGASTGRVVRHDHHRARRVPGERSRDASKERRGEAAAAAGAHHDKRGADVVGDLAQLVRDAADLEALFGVHRRGQGVGRALEDLVDASPAAVAGPLPLRLQVRRGARPRGRGSIRPALRSLRPARRLYARRARRSAARLR